MPLSALSLNSMLHNFLSRSLLACFAGILFASGFAPWAQGYLTLLALSVLFFLWQNDSPKCAFVTGLLFGLCAFGLGVSWVFISVYQFGKAGITQACLITFMFVFFWALFPAFTGYCSTWLAQKKKSKLRLATIVLMWFAVEYVRGTWILNGFPWLQTSYSQLQLPLAGYVPLIGSYGVNFLVALTAASLVYWLDNFEKKHLVFLMITVIWVSGALLIEKTWTTAENHPIKAALIQGNISQDQKWLPENRIKTLQFYQEQTQAHWGADIIVWPETAVPALFDEVKTNYLWPLSEEAEQNQASLVVSVPMQSETLGKFYNALVVFGQGRGVYRKIHLLPFGEYMPLQPVSGYVLKQLGLNLGNFLPGREDQPLPNAGKFYFTPSICYEDAFNDVNGRYLKDSAFLVNVTNDAWFGDSFEPYQHLQIAQMRALETGRYLLRATNTGVTAIVSPNGQVVAQAPLFKSWVLTGEIKPMNGLTPFMKLGGDKPVVYTIFILLVILISWLNLYRHYESGNYD